MRISKQRNSIQISDYELPEKMREILRTFETKNKPLSLTEEKMSTIESIDYEP